jgi:BASS family bile acid:Na+ symporter
LQPKLTRLSNLMLVTIIGLSLHSYHADILQASAVLLMPLIVLNLLAMLLGFTGARIANLGNKATKTLVIEVGIQNSATGIFIATTLLNNTLLALPAIIYTGIAFVNFAIFMLILKFIAKLGTENGYAKQA